MVVEREVRAARPETQDLAGPAGFEGRTWSEVNGVNLGTQRRAVAFPLIVNGRISLYFGTGLEMPGNRSQVSFVNNC